VTAPAEVALVVVEGIPEARAAAAALAKSILENATVGSNTGEVKNVVLFLSLLLLFTWSWDDSDPCCSGKPIESVESLRWRFGEVGSFVVEVEIVEIGVDAAAVVVVVVDGDGTNEADNGGEGEKYPMAGPRCDK
jgi:hypothetical protein